MGTRSQIKLIPALAILASIASAANFTNPQEINLLERHTPNGSLYYDYSVNAENLGIFPCAVNYLGMGEGWKWHGTQSTAEGFAMFEFPEPQDIARFAIEWRDSSHSPTNFSLADQNGVFFSTNQPTGFSGPMDIAFPARKSEWVRVQSVPPWSANGYYQVLAMGLYPPADAEIPIDGTYNIMWEERSKCTIDGYNCSPWFDHAKNYTKPPSNGSTTIALSQTYHVTGVIFGHHCDPNRFITNLVFEVSTDGENWTQLYQTDRLSPISASVYSGVLRLGAGSGSYLPKSMDDPALDARYLRFSWGENSNPLDIIEVQIFGSTASATSSRSADFTRPDKVNLLERWNPDGSYALGVEYGPETVERPVGTIDYSSPSYGCRNAWVWKDPDGATFVRYIFDSPKRIGRLSVNFRDAHSPTNYVFYDQAGLVVSNGAGPFSGTISHDIEPRTSEWIELRCQPHATQVSTLEINHVGAYLAKGETLEIDGTYNILYEERGSAFFENVPDSWTDLKPGAIGTKPDGAGGSALFSFARPYIFKGVFITQYDQTRMLASPSIEISEDGVNWLTVWTDEDGYRFRSEEPPRDNGYIVFDTPQSRDMPARFLRLNWGPNGNVVEINEVQIFGKPWAPRPGTMLLLK